MKPNPLTLETWQARGPALTSQKKNVKDNGMLITEALTKKRLRVSQVEQSARSLESPQERKDRIKRDRPPGHYRAKEGA